MVILSKRKMEKKGEQWKLSGFFFHSLKMSWRKKKRREAFSYHGYCKRKLEDLIVWRHFVWRNLKCKSRKKNNVRKSLIRESEREGEWRRESKKKLKDDDGKGVPTMEIFRISKRFETVRNIQQHLATMEIMEKFENQWKKNLNFWNCFQSCYPLGWWFA